MRISDRELIGQAKSKGYLTAKWGKTDAVEEEYYKWCEKGDFPLIKAYGGSKFSQVSIDMITSSYDLDKEGQKRIGEVFRKYTRKPSSVGIGHGYCSVDAVPNDSVDILAGEIISIYGACRVKRGES